MALRFSSAPLNGLTLVRAALKRLSAGANPLSERGVDFNALQVNPPHAIYDLRASEIVSGKGLASAHATGFRYLVEAAGRPVAAAEVHTDSSGSAKLVANVNYGPFVAASARALEQLANLDQVRAASYEARLLRFSAIYLMAIWLRSDQGGSDIIYPLTPSPIELQAERPYMPDDFLEAILPLAQKRVTSAGLLVP